MILDSFLDFLVLWYHQQGLSTPRFHLKIARWLEARWRSGESRMLLMAFRAAGKSTLVGLFCAWLLSVLPDLRILVLAADQALAAKMVRNVKRIIEKHPACAVIRPRQADQWASDRFTVERALELRDPSMLAQGLGGNITGSRADVVICDDVEVPKTSDSQAKRIELRQRLGEIEFVLTPGGTQLYVGTPHSYFTIYGENARPEAGEEEPFLSGFTRLVLPVIDEQGRPLWPERYPAKKIEAIRRRSGPNRFASQMLLQPVDIAEARLDPGLLRCYDEELVYSEGNREIRLELMERRLISASCWWDPAFGAPGKGDASVIACVFTDEEGRHYLHRVAYLRHDPELSKRIDEATQLCRQVARFLRDHYLPAVTIETNGLGRFLPGLLRQELSLSRTPAAVLERATHTPKTQRIISAFDALLAARGLHAHSSLWSTPFVREMREWRPERSNQADDGLDAVAGAILAEPIRLTRGPYTGRQAWAGAPPNRAAESDFEL